MNKTTRLSGIDLCRGLAAFAVILVHSGDETWGIPVDQQAIEFRYLFNFAVPFFLAASFYFATKKSPLNISRSFWQKKFRRIIVPYFIWSAFYLIAKSIIFLITRNTSSISQLLSDPLAIVFFGGASYHLYFLPLLVSGTLLLYLANYFTKQQKSIILLAIFSIFSLVIYQILLLSNNNIGFPSLLNIISAESWFYSVWRIFLVNLAWILRCLPYFFIAVLINQLLRKINCHWLYQKQVALLLLVIFLVVNIIGKNFLPHAITEIVIAYSLLLFGISISQISQDNRLIINLGLCSFGIYLIHPFIKSVMEIFLVKLLPEITQSVSITSMLIYSISSFLASWMTIAFLLKNKIFSQYI